MKGLTGLIRTYGREWQDPILNGDRRTRIRLTKDALRFGNYEEEEEEGEGEIAEDGGEKEEFQR